MSRLFYRPSEQLEGIRPYFPLLHGIALVDDLRAISGIISILLLPGCLLRMGDSRWTLPTSKLIGQQPAC